MAFGGTFDSLQAAKTRIAEDNASNYFRAQESAQRQQAMDQSNAAQQAELAQKGNQFQAGQDQQDWQNQRQEDQDYFNKDALEKSQELADRAESNRESDTQSKAELRQSQEDLAKTKLASVDNVGKTQATSFAQAMDSSTKAAADYADALAEQQRLQTLSSRIAQPDPANKGKLRPIDPAYNGAVSDLNNQLTANAQLIKKSAQQKQQAQKAFNDVLKTSRNLGFEPDMDNGVLIHRNTGKTFNFLPKKSDDQKDLDNSGLNLDNSNSGSDDGGSDFTGAATAVQPQYQVKPDGEPVLDFSGAAQQPPPPAQPKTLDRITAGVFLDRAGGDKNKARQMAMAAGYSI